MRLLLALTLLVASSCTTRQSIGVPTMLSQADVTVPMHNNGKIDLLFMIDDSSSMDPMQAELRAHFGELVTQISGANSGVPVDLHIGVVTSDYGAGDTAGGGCDASPGGKRGLLQAIGAAADPTCKAPVGTPFISYAVAADGTVSSNLPSGQSLVQTFTCMASVGAKGCGFEHQLESVYAALHGDALTSGFLRDDAALTVVFVTNEDDGSAPPTAKFYEQANDPAGTSAYGQYTTYRQTRFAVACGSPLALPPEAASSGNLDRCVPAPAVKPDDIGLAYDISRYTSFFTAAKAAGGVKDSPWDVAVVALAAPPTPFRTRDIDPSKGAMPFVDCPSPMLSTNCIVALDHSCENHVSPGFFGDPAVRISAVVNAVPVHQMVSICGDDLDVAPSYGGIMSQVGTLMGSQAIGGCLFSAPVNPQLPMCTVTIGSGVSAIDVPSCTTGEMPCWTVQADPRCPTVRDPASGDDEHERLVLRGVDASQPVQATCHVYTP